MINRPIANPRMIHYTSADSGVESFGIGENFIDVKFRDRDDTYRYGIRRPGADHVVAMAELALKGRGLATYINQHVRENYESKRPG